MWLFIGDEDEVLPAATTDLAFASALPAGLTLSRAEATLARSRTDGRWISYPADTARPDIDPITLESRGTLVEPSRSQLVYKSRTPGYTPVLATSTTDATIQTPFGLGALKLTPTTVAGFHGFNLYYN